MKSVDFAEELASILPADIPNRPDLVRKAALHLDRIVEANQNFNLTRITSTREAAIKHVLDSVLPWRLFEGATHILDAGTGAGYPGIPLAIVLPGIRFTLSESIGKKARFVEAAVAELDLPNIRVEALRAEDILQKATFASGSRFILTGRAVAPVAKAAALFAPALQRIKGSRALFYKGPSVQEELAEARLVLQRQRLRCGVIHSYDLPENLGTRFMVELSAAG